jgi:hypothetical protein
VSAETGRQKPTPPRRFAVAPSGVIDVLSIEDNVALMGVSPAVSAAYDLMVDDGYPPEKAAKLAMDAERSGRDPEAWARHFIKLRKAWR